MILRPLAWPLTLLLIRTPLSANGATILQFVFGIAAVIVLALDMPHALLVACVVMHLSLLMDCVDGEIARYRDQCSLRGLFLDNLNHQIVLPLWGAALGYYGFLQLDQPWWILLGVVLGLLTRNVVHQASAETLLMVLEKRLDHLVDDRTSDEDSPPRSATWFDWFNSIIVPPGGVSVLSVAVAVAGAFGRVDIAMLMTAGLTGLLLLRSLMLLRSRLDGRWVSAMYHDFRK